MFCVKCGKAISEGGSFCAYCGSAAVTHVAIAPETEDIAANTDNSQTMTPRVQETGARDATAAIAFQGGSKKKYLPIAAVVIVIITAAIIFYSNTRGGSLGRQTLDGSWRYVSEDSRGEYGRMGTFTFSGNKFTSETRIRVARHVDTFESRERWLDEFEAQKQTRGVEIYEEGINESEWFVVYGGTIEGTFSTTENEIEFITSDGNIHVYDFSQTKNTITLNILRINSTAVPPSSTTYNRIN